VEQNSELFAAIGTGDRERVAAIVQEIVDTGGDFARLLDGTMIPAMRDVGERFSRGEVYVPEMLISARAMQAGLDIVEPLLAGADREPRARVCVGTVRGDLHDIGKNLVAMMLRGAGFEVKDLGVDCQFAQFEEAVADGYSIVCLSALLTTTMPAMKEAVAGFSGRDDVSVIVGGAPVTREYADEIGADGYGKDANEAVRAVAACLPTV
jgi:5-methyltetrahydrofolate--homocysteine methyltransferase